MKRLLAIAIVGLVAAGCETTIDIENLPARVTSVGPVAASNQIRLENGTTVFSQLSIDYTLRDDEGDDVEIDVEICETGGTACGAPFRGFGGDGVSRVPTAPYDTDVSHVFEWAVGCGRVVGSEVVAADTTTFYVARVRVVGSGEPALESASFRLDELGIGESAPCL